MLTIYRTLRQDMSPSGLKPLTAHFLARRLLQKNKPADGGETVRFPSLLTDKVPDLFESPLSSPPPPCTADRHTELPTIELAEEMRTDDLLSAVLYCLFFLTKRRCGSSLFSRQTADCTQDMEMINYPRCLRPIKHIHIGLMK